MRSACTSSVSATLVALIFAIAGTPPCAAAVNEVHVGPNGQYTTVSAALAAVLAAPESQNWIKIQAGVDSTEHLVIPVTWTANLIWLSGGWDPGFSSNSGNPADTVLSGGLSGRVIDILATGGSVAISDLSVVDGWETSGAGLGVDSSGSVNVFLDDLWIHGNSAVNSGGAWGGGLDLLVDGSSTLTIDGCLIEGNVALTSGLVPTGGAALKGSIRGTSRLDIIDTVISNNSAASESSVYGAAIDIDVDDFADVSLVGCTLENNIASSSGAITVDGVALRAFVGFYASLTIERNRFVGNGATVPVDDEQISISTSGHSLAQLRDSIVAGGPGDGLRVRADSQSLARLTNLTVAANDGDGVGLNQVMATGAVISLANTICYANLGLNLHIYAAAVTQTGNLISVDPGFVDLPSLDLRFEPGSIAEDAGDPAPLGGLGDGDLRGGVRVLGTAPDVGAYEGDVDLLFSDGFDVDGPWRWSDAVGLPIS